MLMLMATTERRIETADRIVARLLPILGGELRDGRLSAGHSLDRIARLVGGSRSRLARIERGEARNLSVRDLTRVAAVIGLDVSVRLYPSGPPLRDVAHVELLERLRSTLSPTLGWRLEVPLPGAGDRRAFDAMITGAGDPIVVEAETRIRDLQALHRRIGLKCRDGGVTRVILLVRRSATNREVLGAADASFWAAYPIPAARALHALREGRDPRGSTVIVR
jgi:transcriptional regulator with XRE-family HTH domain